MGDGHLHRRRTEDWLFLVPVSEWWMGCHSRKEAMVCAQQQGLIKEGSQVVSRWMMNGRTERQTGRNGRQSFALPPVNSFERNLEGGTLVTTHQQPCPANISARTGR